MKKHKVALEKRIFISFFIITFILVTFIILVEWQLVKFSINQHENTSIKQVSRDISNNQDELAKEYLFELIELSGKSNFIRSVQENEQELLDELLPSANTVVYDKNKQLLAGEYWDFIGNYHKAIFAQSTSGYFFSTFGDRPFIIFYVPVYFEEELLCFILDVKSMNISVSSQDVNISLYSYAYPSFQRSLPNELDAFKEKIESYAEEMTSKMDRRDIFRLSRNLTVGVSIIYDIENQPALIYFILAQFLAILILFFLFLFLKEKRKKTQGNPTADSLELFIRLLDLDLAEAVLLQISNFCKPSLTKMTLLHQKLSQKASLEECVQLSGPLLEGLSKNIALINGAKDLRFHGNEEENISPGKILSSILSSYHNLLNSKKIRVFSEVPEGMKINASKNAFRALILSLLHCSLQYTLGEEKKEKIITLSWEKREGKEVFYYSDNGVFSLQPNDSKLATDGEAHDNFSQIYQWIFLLCERAGGKMVSLSEENLALEMTWHS